MPSITSLSRPSNFGHALIPCHDYDNDKGQVVESPTSDGSDMTTIIGVCITDERTLSRKDQSISKTDSAIGMLTFKDLNELYPLSQLRAEMRRQIPSLPNSYLFVSATGWHISFEQEKELRLKHVLTSDKLIRIRRDFKKPRIGVRTTEGETLGFVFSDANSSVHQLREAIDIQLKDAFKHHLGEKYRFIERNGWPITFDQEMQLMLIDVKIGHHVCLEFTNSGNIRPIKSIPARLTVQQSLPDTVELHSPTVPPPTPNFNVSLTTPISQDSTDSNVSTDQDWNVKKKKTRRLKPLEQLSFRTVKDSERKKVEKEPEVAKPVLISYVRAESAQNALDLKKELTELGFSVYLDVHEIKTGIDWQDALNFAVTNCEVFVPLITPRYGQTQWTNREVKLADVLNKFIVPVNFTETWPPECLAIQFATTQYIQWRTQGDLDQDDGKLDKLLLDKISCRRVAREIAERCKGFTKKPKLHSRLSNRRSVVTRSPSEDLPQVQTMESLKEMDENVETPSNQLVVISAHPKQEAISHELKTVLEEDGYRVWRSLEIFENSHVPEILHSSYHGGEVLTRNYHDINVRIAESKTKNTTTNISWADQVDKVPEKLPLTSQISLISQVSSLTPEKIERLRTFQQKADEAAVVVVVVSDAYTKSKTSQQQVYYCEQRKKVIAVKSDQNDCPGWFHMLLGNDMVKDISSPQFMDTFKARIKRAIDPLSSSPPKDGTTEVKIQYLVNFLQKNIPTVDDSYIYIAGSTQLRNTRSDEICKAIGLKLAQSGDLHVVTGGYYGAAEIVAQSYINQRPCNDSSVFHLLPMRDSNDLKCKARQNADGSFQAVPFGKTIFLGDSIKERELAAARLFSTCVLIEGGPASAHEVEQFIWNDHNVIPIISTGGAAAGMFGIPAKIFEVPCGVSHKDWDVLRKIDANADVVADAVIRIIRCLKKACSSGSPSIEKSRPFKSRLKNIGKSSKISESQSSLFDHEVLPHVKKSSVKSRMRRIMNVFKK